MTYLYHYLIHYPKGILLQLLLLIFILIPLIEIGVFIQVGDIIGLTSTLIIVFVTAIIGINLLKQQGLKTWFEIQKKMNSGQIPAKELASAAQILFAGGLLLTPGFVTDIVGFTLMIPNVRLLIATFLFQRWTNKVSIHTYQTHQRDSFNDSTSSPTNAADIPPKRTIEGEYEDHSNKP
ncbi:FxsA family protein [Aliikangiella sp. IMCC44359]|uniref:FxsA family protein n=1 Tax=Aliikangiella sp. IMCC44359 TaxID=3459125 RepID=UPI00403ACF86